MTIRRFNGRAAGTASATRRDRQAARPTAPGDDPGAQIARQAVGDVLPCVSGLGSPSNFLLGLPAAVPRFARPAANRSRPACVTSPLSASLHSSR